MHETPTKPLDVMFYPDYRETNPYQALLYGSVGPTVHAHALDNLAGLGGAATGPAAVLHLHWETAAFISPGLQPGAVLDLLSEFRAAGGRIIWTVHNLEPHDTRYRAAAQEVRAGLLTLADIVHFHSLPALAAAMDRWDVPLHKVRIIAHGNYDGAYPVFQKAAARAELGLDLSGMVALLPGQIRAYKNPAGLIGAFLKTAGETDCLLISGHQATDAKDVSFPDDPRVVVKHGFAATDDLARCFAAADFVVLPYSQSLTSGSALLAASLGRGVLGTDTPGLQDAVISSVTGVLVDGAGPDALEAALSQAFADGPNLWAVRGAAAARQSRARDWRCIGPVWAATFADLARLPRPARRLEGAR